MHYILFYDVVDDYLTKRAQYREAHLKLAKEAYDRRELVLGGAFAEPVDGVALVFRGPSPVYAENFVKNDPYVKNGIVTSWRIRKWTTVIGDGTAP